MITTHVLDAAVGRPANGVAVRLFNESEEVASAHTDADGRAALGAIETPGTYRIVFDTGAYFEGQTFYPEVIVTFTITDPAQHHHVPLLLSPFAYSTYRGS